MLVLMADGTYTLYVHQKTDGTWLKVTINHKAAI